MCKKLSIKTPFFSNDNIYNKLAMPYPIDEAQRFLKEAKPLLIGHTLDEVLVRGWDGDWDGTASETLSLNENDLDSEWVGHFIFVINKQHFEVFIMAVNHYELGLNTIEVGKIVKTKGKKANDVKGIWCNQKGNDNYLDISHIFEDSVLKQKITDIELTADNYEDYQYLQNVIIKFENGYSLRLEEGLDNTIIQMNYTEKEITENQKIRIVIDSDYDSRATRLEAVLPQIKDAVCGKPLTKILNKAIWHADFKEWNVCITSENVHQVYFEDFEFIIGDKVLKVVIDAPSYGIELNNDNVEKIYPTKDIPIKDWADCGYKPTPEYNDISHIYSFLIGAKVTDITIKKDTCYEDANLEAFIIHLSNGRRIEVSNQDDNPWINVR